MVQAGLKTVFWISALTMLIAFLIISTLPEISLDPAGQDPNVRETPVK
jgi:hypothetical protein